MHEPLITLTGNVAQAPVLRAIAGGTPVASFRVATTPRRRGTLPEEWVDGETIWFGVSAWRALGEHCASSLKKGDRVAVTGRFTTRTWTSTDGKDHLALELDATSVGLELSRDNAVSLKNATRSGEPAVDLRTGELRDGPITDAGQGHDVSPWETPSDATGPDGATAYDADTASGHEGESGRPGVADAAAA